MGSRPTPQKSNLWETLRVKRPFFSLRSQQLRFGVFCEGVFQKMPALEGQFLKEITVRFAGENSEHRKHKTKLCAEVPERPLPKDPFFQLLKETHF